MDGLNSNLNLNGPVAPTVIPALGEWAPAGLPSTRAKKRMRVWIVLLLVLALTVISLFGWWIFGILQGG